MRFHVNTHSGLPEKMCNRGLRFKSPSAFASRRVVQRLRPAIQAWLGP